MGSFKESTVRIFVSAGEASGDLHGSHLVRAIRNRLPNVHITCLGGPLLREAGAEVLVDNRDLAVVGLFEVFRHWKVILDSWRRIRGHIVCERPDFIVLIDFPDFNFLLARFARRVGIKVFYYIGPQVWAWRRGRVRTLKRLVDEMLVILPFEPAYYARHRMETTYVGHPLLDVLEDAPSREEAGDRYRSGRAGPVVGLLPGSRHGEIRALLPILLDAASILRKEIPGLSFLLPVAPSVDRRIVEERIEGRNLPVRVVAGDTYGVIQACDLALCASGTVTLEAAVLGTPMVIVYKVSGLTYHVGRHLIRTDAVGLPNLIAGRRIVPELLQEEAHPARIAAEALHLLRNEDRLQEQRRELARIRARLGEPGAAERVAGRIVERWRSPSP